MAENVETSSNPLPSQTRLEAWLRDPWWPPSFLRQRFNWKIPAAVGAAAALLVAWLAGGIHSSIALLGAINLVVYAGVPLALALLVVWKARNERGRLIACDLAAVLIVLGCLLPGSWLGRAYLDQRLASTKAVAQSLVPQLEAYHGEQGRFPEALGTLRAAGSAPLDIKYSATPAGDDFQLSVPDPSCLLSCSWIYDRQGGDWVYLHR